MTETSVCTTFQFSNVTHVTPSKRQRSQLTNISSITSSNITGGQPIPEIPTNPRSQTSPTNTLLVHIPHSESVERSVKHKPSTAIKTVRHQPQLNLGYIADTENRQLLPLQLPSAIRTTSSKKYILH